MLRASKILAFTLLIASGLLQGIELRGRGAWPLILLIAGVALLTYVYSRGRRA